MVVLVLMESIVIILLIIFFFQFKKISSNLKIKTQHIHVIVFQDLMELIVKITLTTVHQIHVKIMEVVLMESIHSIAIVQGQALMAQHATITSMIVPSILV